MPNLEFIDSFQHYDLATHNQKYNGIGSGFTIEATSGRFGTKALANSSSSNPFITFKSNLASLYMGMAMHYTNGFQFPERTIFNVRDNFSTQIALWQRVDGRLDVRRGDGTVLGTTLWAGHDLSWDYFEFFASISNIGGSYEVRVNEVTVLTGSGNTRMTSNNFATNLVFGSVASPEVRRLNDLYVHKAQFLGDVRISAIVPNGTGPHQAWTPSTGATHWDLLDEKPPNGDTDYVYTETLNARESNEMEDVVLLGTCQGIQMLHSSRKIEANVRKLRQLLVNGAGVIYDGNEDSIGNSYVYYRECLDISPFTAANFTEAELNAIRYGVSLSL